METLKFPLTEVFEQISEYLAYCAVMAMVALAMRAQIRDRPSKVKGGSFHHGKVGNSSRVICQQNSSTDCMLLPVPVPDDAKLPYFLPFVPKGVTKAQRQIQLTREKRDETAHGKPRISQWVIFSYL